MFLASDPSQTFTVGISPVEGRYKPERGAPAFSFRFLTIAQLRDFTRFSTDREALKAMSDDEVIDKLLGLVCAHMTAFHPAYQDGAATPPLTMEEAADRMNESEAWRLYHRIRLGNRLGPEALKNSELPCDTPGAESAAANAESAPTPQAS